MIGQDIVWAVKQIPHKMEEATRAFMGLLVVSLLSLLMATMALLNSIGVRHAH